MEIDYDTLFCFVDDFCMAFEPWYQRQMLSDGSKKRNRSGYLSLSEMLTDSSSLSSIRYGVL